MRLVQITKPSRDLTSTLMKAKDAKDDRLMVQALADLLDKIFVLDPTKRLTVKEALHHPFVSATAAAASK
jgi:serine/threonine-protein kinase PRP4